MNIIYADSLFALNFAADYLLLLAAGRVCALPLRRWRMAAGAALGGLFAVAQALWPGIFSSFALTMAAAAAMVAVSHGVGKMYLRTLTVFLCAGMALGGAVYAAASLAGLPSGNGYIGVSFKVLVASFGVCWAVLSLVFRGMGRRGARRLYRVKLSSFGRETEFTALLDSGNELRDPVSGDRVLVAEAALFGLPLGSDDPTDQLRTLDALPAYSGRFRLLPYSCVGSEGSLLLVFRPDSLSLDGRDARALVALSPNRLSPTGEYQAIIS